jgi:NAD(P) transhydrogenase subunit beta
MATIQIIISIVLSVAVLAGISMMSKVQTAVRGNLLSALAMLVGVVATLWFSGVASAWTIYPSIIVGALIGGTMARRAQMIQMPQLVALFNGLGGGASALVGILSATGLAFSAEQIAAIMENHYLPFVHFTSMLAIAVGVITLVGSLVAAGKLHRVLNQRPVVLPSHSLFTMLWLLFTIAFIVMGTITSGSMLLPILGCILSSILFGVFFSIRVGGADMPITISLLNSLSGVAGAIAGMAVSDIFLVAVGGIVGASGLLLTQIMCRAMNRSLLSILMGTTRKPTQKQPDNKVQTDNENEQLVKRVMDLEKKIKELEEIVKNLEGRVQTLSAQLDEAEQQKPAVAEEAKDPVAEALANAKNVIIVPGYGMALAQAQHQVKQLADKLVSKGATVRYAIHPVAGRMPGHMNVLLAEADVSYEDLYEMEAINDDFGKADLAIVIGANDVLNPAARNAEGTPIYGMPVLNVDQAPEVIICNYDLKPGYAGVENPLYTRERGVHLELGDAKETLQRLMSLF